MPLLALMMALILSTSCGGLKSFDLAPLTKKRTIASTPVQPLLLEDEESFTAEINDKLKSLHIYHVIAQKNLLQFDDFIADKSLDELYEAGPYLQILAVKTQVEEIERDLAALYEATRVKENVEHKIIQSRIRDFSQRNKLTALSLSNLSQRLGIEALEITDPNFKSLEKEYNDLHASKEFQIYEKNIEHLSHLMEMKIRSENKRFKPASGDQGNITGDEFPAKVWSLTFDNGPDEKITDAILNNLKSRKLQATFFQLSSNSEKLLNTAQALIAAGMEIGSNSHSYRDLAKAGEMRLEKEISASTGSLEKSLKIDIQFFRLPFGSGVTIPSIRQTIARNNLIHVIWNIDSLDWMAQSPDRIVQRTKKLMKKTARDSGIILFHDVHDRSIEASKEIMDYLMLDGRRTCTIGKIVKDMNEGYETVCLKK